MTTPERQAAMETRKTPWLRAVVLGAVVALAAGATAPGAGEAVENAAATAEQPAHASAPLDYWAMMFVFLLATFVGLGVIRRVSRLLYTPLMSLTDAISAIAVVGAIIVAGNEYPLGIRILGAIALFASMTNIVSGFLITDRMLQMFKTDRPGDGGRA